MRYALLLALILGCGESSRGRDCEPARQSGCEGDRLCAVAANGTPTCFNPVATPAAEGDLCEAADACDAGLGCLRVGGVARCLRFCEPSTATDRPCLDGAIPPGTHPLSEQARCLAVVVDRPDIGACALPCRTEIVSDCPAGLACAPSLLAGMALCAEPGSAQAGEDCGPDVPCDAGLACVAEGSALVCRPYIGPAGCPAGELSRPIPGVIDGATGRELRVCSPR